MCHCSRSCYVILTSISTEDPTKIQSWTKGSDVTIYSLIIFRSQCNGRVCLLHILLRERNIFLLRFLTMCWVLNPLFFFSDFFPLLADDRLCYCWPIVCCRNTGSPLQIRDGLWNTRISWNRNPIQPHKSLRKALQY